MNQSFLDLMGITNWQLKVSSYALFIQQSENLDEEQKPTIAKIIQALNWPQTEIAVYCFSTVEDVLHRIVNHQVQKAILFGFPVQNLPLPHYAFVPSLKDILRNPALKKEAWRLMQPLINFSV